MKETFRKIEILAHRSDRTLVTTKLQELGVIHLEVDANFSNKEIEVLEHRKSRLIKAIDFMKSFGAVQTNIDKALPFAENSVNEVAEQILELKQQKEVDGQEEETLAKKKKKLKYWGDFDADKISELAQFGLQISFYIAEKKEFKAYDFSNLIHEVINQKSSQIYFVVLSHQVHPSLPFERVQLPQMTKLEIRSRRKKLKTNKVDRAEAMHTYSPYLAVFSEELISLEDQVKLHLVNGSYSEYGEGAILHLKGWFPAKAEAQLVHQLRQEDWSFLISKPTADDRVPVLLRNARYPKLFEPITQIFQLPRYHEMDLTPFIAVFYPILFAYCLGDAGYGLILLFAAVTGWFTFLKGSRNLAALGVILGIFTTLMGVIKSGSVFGMPIVSETPNPLFEYLAQYVIIPDERGVVFNAFNVALMIGVVQILIGILLSIVKKIRYKGFIASISQIGKFLMVVSLIWLFLADMQEVLALQAFPALRRLTLIIGVLLVLFFHDMQSPLLKRTASGLLPIFFILTGMLGDILSYVRLFALGVASSVLGLVVNQIGIQIMGDSWWGIVIGVVFLIFGHSLNLALAALGAFVHPLRLTFVEFYNNAQFEGGGVAYKPLKKIKIEHSK
ncbi:MAG: V/A-type H+-transporting ATPase subunit I [Marivirga sp.]